MKKSGIINFDVIPEDQNSNCQSDEAVGYVDFIVYTRDPDNCKQVADFIGDIPPCPICNDYGEYEDNGPHGCQPCNSRCLPLIDYTGKRVYVDWQDRIEKHEDGLHLIVSR